MALPYEDCFIDSLQQIYEINFPSEIQIVLCFFVKSLKLSIDNNNTLGVTVYFENKEYMEFQIEI